MTTTSTRPLIGRPADDRVALDRRLQTTLEDTLVGSPNAVELRPDPLTAYQERLVTTRPNLAEVFHANSRLTRGWGQNRPKDVAQLAAVRQWYHETAYAPEPGDVDDAAAQAAGVRIEVSRLPDPLSVWLGRATENPELTEALYAIDLWPVAGDAVYRLPAGGPAVWLERRLPGPAVERLHPLFFGLPDLPPHPTAMVLLVFSPWRYQLFCGPRGYRHALVDVGRALSVLRRVAVSAGLLYADTLDHLDQQVDRLVNVDGVERTCVAGCLVARPGDES